jgi:pilus assembly protein Flp/PilA
VKGGQAAHVLSLARDTNTTLLSEEIEMHLKLWKLYAPMQNLMMREEGQDLIEYALVVALIAFAATVGMNSLASGINTAFSNISLTLASYTG